MRKFTSAELFVTMSLVMLLGTISMVSYVGYSSSSRDFLRIRNVADIETSLELYKRKTLSYPNPSYSVSMKYHGKEVWKQGTVGKSLIRSMDRLSVSSRDPLFRTEFAYSVTKSGQEYQIGAIMEKQGVKFNMYLPRNIIPGKSRGEAFVVGSYNGFIAKADSDDGDSYVLALPSILSNDLTYGDVGRVVDEQRLIYNGYKNLPHNLSKFRVDIHGGFYYSPTRVVGYKGDLNDLLNKKSKEKLRNSIFSIYEGTIVENQDLLTKLFNSDGLNKILGIDLQEANIN